MVAELEQEIQKLPTDSNGPGTDKLRSIQEKFLKIPDQFFSSPDSIFETQDHVRAVVILYLQKIEGIPDSKIRADCKKAVAPLSHLQFIQFPRELSLEIFLFLPVEDILKIRFACTHYKDFIDSSPVLQTKIAHHFFLLMQPKANIPLDALKIGMAHHKLAVEINENLNLWKFSQRLSQAMPWISHLIIKDGKANELAELFRQLQQSKRLVTLYLLNCEVDSKAIDALQSLITPDALDLKPVVIYLCNLRPAACELPSQLSTASSNVVIIDADKAIEYSIERFLTKESDRIDLEELNSQIENEYFPREAILKKMKEMNPIILAGMVSSIWYSKLAPTTQDILPVSKRMIQRKVFEFVSDQPHHPAFSAAVWRNLEKYRNGD